MPTDPIECRENALRCTALSERTTDPQLKEILKGLAENADIFGDLHLVEFCHRAQFGPIDWEGAPAGQPLRIRGIACDTHNCEDNECGADWQARATAVAMRRPEPSTMRREAGIVGK
jgi:hypothetical protein